MSPRLSVVVCSRNGAAGVDRCLRALAAQTIHPAPEVIVVDDGSTDGTGDVARGHGARVLRHETTRGPAAARNTGSRVASAPILAFLDDDCAPEPQWAEQLIGAYRAGVIGVAGALLVGGPPGFMTGYLARHNPLQPQELSLARSSRLCYRLYLYLARQWAPPGPGGPRDVYSCAAANMSVWHDAFREVGGFDERIRFASEDDDLCRRLRQAFPAGRLVYAPGARAVHHFEPSPWDTLRRRRAYGQGAARMYRAYPGVPPAVFPWPLAVLAVLALSAFFPVLLAAVALAPQLLYPAALRSAVRIRRPSCLLDPYLQLAEECCADLGFIEGLWRFRHLVPGVPAARPPGGLTPGRPAARQNTR
ncbi:MAG TPA: glycosyltransferase [Streptosporangiaceae bacterium]|nr:glycosyltransferase [Streptosporangiaceae bacterium]